MCSGIQSPNGGVARYYMSDLGQNLPVSTEITGYFVSTMVYLHSLTGDSRYLDRARSAAHFLTGAWHESQAMPFEVAPAEFTYFFDCGIIARGLLSVWRATNEACFLKCARAVGDAMLRDFPAKGGLFHPILTLPDKRPTPWEPARWSRAPGCYQLKAAMVWWDLWEVTGDNQYRQAYDRALREAMRNANQFLPGHAERRKVVDRLHAYSYFLEGLLPMSADPGVRAALCAGITRVAGYLREFAPEFERSDVYAQLLRVRLFSQPLDRRAARWEAERLQEFAVTSDDTRLDGGFYFGRSGGKWEPYINPVSAGFGLQALAMWHGGDPVDRHLLI